MKIAINYFGDLIIRDATNKTHIYKQEEQQIIRTALYKWTQTKKPMIYEELTSTEQ